MGLSVYVGDILFPQVRRPAVCDSLKCDRSVVISSSFMRTAALLFPITIFDQLKTRRVVGFLFDTIETDRITLADGRLPTALSRLTERKESAGRPVQQPTERCEPHTYVDLIGKL